MQEPITRESLIATISKAIQSGAPVRIWKDEVQRTVLAITANGTVYVRAKANKPVCYTLTSDELARLAQEAAMWRTA